ncbi:MAG TPA: tRNA pseudouridine(38-40) synthase TruA [Gemmatimonadales bacterium]
MSATQPMLLILHYDGSTFAGWQRQKSDRTVQAELEAALERLTGSKLPVRGAGRTDAGVHAVGQAAAAAVPGKWQPAELVRAMNAVLPSDVWVASACRMQPGFDPRRDAMERTYCYRIGLDTGARSPFRRRWEWSLTPPLDEALLEGAAAMLEGTHGFQALCAAGQEKPHYRCTIHEALWQHREDGTGLEFWITADRFLHHMVRFLVGFMMEAARHRRPVSDLLSLLDSTDNQAASPPAPPQGLFLVNVRYPGEAYA